MQRAHKLYEHLYKSNLHLVVTFFFIVAPLVYLALYAKISGITQIDFAKLTIISILRLIVAYGAAVLLAWPLALALHRGKRSLVALPIFDVLQSFPTFAALPLAVIAWGQTNFTIIFFLTLTIIWPIFFSIISSLKRMNQEWNEVATITALTPWQYLSWILVPVSIPGLITGSVIGLGEGWEALVATEIIVAIPNGLGAFFQSVSTNPTITALGIIGLLFIIFSINKLLWLPLLERSHRMLEES